MRLYGKVALLAVQYCIESSAVPLNAWIQAATKTTNAPESRKKSCPKNAFLGLVNAGKVMGVSRNFDSPIDANGGYALAGLDELRRDSSLAANPDALWDRVKPVTVRNHNGQMDVVCALWAAGHIS